MRSRTSILFSTLPFYVLTILCGMALASARARDGGNTSGAGAQQPSIAAAGSETVYFFARDSDGKAVTDLRAADLSVRVGGMPAQITQLLPPGTAPPLSLEVLLDVSGSRMNELPGVEQKYAYDFFQGLLRPGDRIFVWEFNIDPKLLSLTADSSDPKALAADVATELVGSKGATSFYDAIFVACENDLQTPGYRRAVLAVTDGGDTSSMHRPGNVETILLRENIQFFAVNVGPADKNFAELGTFADLERKHLKSLAENGAGGSVFEIGTDNRFHDALDGIREYLRNEYAVTFTPSAAVPEKKSRQFEIGTIRPGVRIVGPQEIRKLK